MPHEKPRVHLRRQPLLIEHVHRPVFAVHQKDVKGLSSLVQGLVEELLLVRPETRQHVLFRREHGVSAYSYLQSKKVVRTKMVRNRSHALMATVATIPSNPHPAEFHVQVIMHNDEMFRSDILLFHERENRCSGKVHVRIGLREKETIGYADDTSSRLAQKAYPEPFRKPVEYEVANIVSGIPVR